VAGAVRFTRALARACCAPRPMRTTSSQGRRLIGLENDRQGARAAGSPAWCRTWCASGSGPTVVARDARPPSRPRRPSVARRPPRAARARAGAAGRRRASARSVPRRDSAPLLGRARAARDREAPRRSPVATVKSWLYRALSELRRDLAGETGRRTRGPCGARWCCSPRARRLARVHRCSAEE
jgi:hypothetical protein